MPTYAVIPELECLITLDGSVAIAMVGQILSVAPVRVLGLYSENAALSKKEVVEMQRVWNLRVDAEREKVYGQDLFDGFESWFNEG